MGASGVTTQSIRNGFLFGLIGPSGRYVGFPDAAIDDAIDEAERQVEQELSTRLEVTEFQGSMGPGAPTLLASDFPVEAEASYPWPALLPGDGWPLFRVRVRPLVELVSFTVSFPGGIVSPVDLSLDWFRTDHLLGEIVMAPSRINAPLAFSGLSAPLVGLSSRQVPQSVLIRYRAGLGKNGLNRWPKIGRLVQLYATIQLLPQLSFLMNPEVLTSESADGLSQSRGSGFVFKDMEDRLQAEADKTREALLGLWDGPGSLVVL